MLFKQKKTGAVVKLSKQEFRKLDSQNIFTHSIYHGSERVDYKSRLLPQHGVHHRFGAGAGGEGWTVVHRHGTRR